MPYQTAFFILSFALFLGCTQSSSSGESSAATDSLAVENPQPDTSPASEPAPDDYLAKGRTVSAAVFAALSSALQQALEEGGVARAVEYCKLNALPIVDSLSRVHQARIRRTSHRLRNPLNAPTRLEEPVLNDYEYRFAKEQALEPIVKKLSGERFAYFAPIYTQEFCLRCHGKLGETLSPIDYREIKKHYPEDNAIGFAAGDLRGMWSIVFETRRGESDKGKKGG